MTTAITRVAAASLLSMLASLAVTAQQAPPRDALRPEQRPTPTGTAEISGTVTMAGSTQPARKTRVNLSGGPAGGGRGGRSATTDDTGQYAFTALPAGQYSLSASKPGHVTVTYGQRQPGRPGTSIELSDGQKFRADLQIPKGSVITGTVLDEHGEPTPQTSVRVMRFLTASGERTLAGTNTASTDDRGIYRVFGLMPGEYVVCATPRNTGIMPDMQRMEVELRSLQTAVGARISTEQMQQVTERIAAVQGAMAGAEAQTAPGYAPVCYPGTVSTAGATPVTVGIAEERTAVDFQLQLAPLANIEGIVVNSTGAQLTQMNVTLTDAASLGPSMLNMTARPDAEGRFQIRNVPPGQYRLTARSTIAPPRPAPGEAPAGRGRGAARGGGPGARPLTVWASADLSVDGRNLSNVLLSLQQGVSVSGQIAFEGTTQAPPTDLTRVRVSISPVGRSPFGGASSAQVDAGGRFTIPGVPPGRYRLNATGAGNWFTESAMIGGQDALDFPFEIKGHQDVSGVTVTLTDRRTELTGKVVDDKNQPAVEYTIIIYPADARYWAGASRRIQTTRPSTDGTYTFRNLPPGDYRIATPYDIEPGSTSDPAVLQQLDASSMRVTLQPGERKVQNIRLGGG